MTTTDHRAISSTFLRQADEEYAGGDLLQASEKAWGAVAHYVKAMAKDRGWSSNSHKAVVDIAQQLVDHSRHHVRLIATAERLHSNFYESFCTESVVRLGIDDAKELVATLKAIDEKARKAEWEEARREDARHEPASLDEMVGDGSID